MARKTPLFDVHLRLGARMVEFAGWEMPVQYTGIVAEHMAVRRSAGIFDVSHMGELRVWGPEAEGFLQEALSTNIAGLEYGRAVYALLLNPDGGIIDDLLVYRLMDGYMMVVNAANAAADYEWLSGLAAGQRGVEVRDVSHETALIALQGPASKQMLAGTEGLRYYRFREGVGIGGTSCTVSRTGYTGEYGYEIFCRPDEAAGLWEYLLEKGALPAGLGARDTLRLEAGLPLHGQDITPDTTPVEAGLMRYVSMEKPAFCGRAAIEDRLRNGVGEKLSAFEMLDRGIPRTGYAIYAGEDRVGTVTSGSHSPCLGKGIGMGYLGNAFCAPGTMIDIDIRGRRSPARVVERPFYRRGEP